MCKKFIQCVLFSSLLQICFSVFSHRIACSWWAEHQEKWNCKCQFNSFSLVCYQSLIASRLIELCVSFCTSPMQAAARRHFYESEERENITIRNVWSERLHSVRRFDGKIFQNTGLVQRTSECISVTALRVQRRCVYCVRAAPIDPWHLSFEVHALGAYMSDRNWLNVLESIDAMKNVATWIASHSHSTAY